LFYNTKGKLLLQQETAMSSDAMLKLLNILYGFDLDIASTENSGVQFENAKQLEVEVPRSISNYNDATISQLKVVSAHKAIVQQPRKTSMVRNRPAIVPLLNKAILDKAEGNNLKSPIQLFDPNYVKVPEVYKPKLVQKQETKIVHSAPTYATANYANPAKPKLVSAIVEHKTIISKVSEPKVYTEPRIKSTSSSVSSMNSSVSSKKDASIQFAAYNSYDDVLKGMYKMKRKIKTPLTIVEEYTNGKLMYKLVSADQLTKTDAHSQIRSLKSQGIDCFVRKTP